MSSQQIPNEYQTIENRHVTLLELLDRIIDKGVMVKGEILLSVADIDLIYLNLGLLLSSVKTVVQAANVDGNRQVSLQRELLGEPPLELASKDASSLPQEQSAVGHTNGKTKTRTVSSAENVQQNRSAGKKMTKKATKKAAIDQEKVEQGLVKLVLALVDLIRQLMEKQAIRRIEADQLDAREIERVGNAFFLLNEKMVQLKKMFGLTDEDLKLDLGPLGELS
jgi:hypothetical protein